MSPTKPQTYRRSHVAPTRGQPKNVGDEPATIGQMLLYAAGRHRGAALQFPRAGATASISYPELGKLSAEIAGGLIALGIDTGDRVAILGVTSAEWTLADCGALCAGAVVTPIYHTNSPEECAYVLAHSGARLIFCADPAQAEKIEVVRRQCPALEHVVLFDGSAPGAITLGDLRARGREVAPERVRERAAAVAPDEVATLVYTSGTTGPPKGCMLSHRSLLSTTRMYAAALGFEERHSVYQFLPLAHVLARVAQLVAFSVGARVIYWSGDATNIADELADTQPTHFPAVPRIYEKIHDVVTGRVADSNVLKRSLFEWALRQGATARQARREGQRLGAVSELKYRVADRLVLAKVRAIFGAGLELAMVGAAPIGRELLEFFDACGVLVLEGYGLTESCAAATINTVDAVKLGTVGRPLPGSQVQLADDGEILVRGPQVFEGYYKDPEATAAALTPGGWLRTGDVGAIASDGFVSITGRKKDLIITSSGKNIAPANIENLLRERRYVSEAVVFGDNRPYLVALLTLDQAGIEALANRLGIDAEFKALAEHRRVRAEIQKEIDAVNRSLARIEQIKRFAILEHDLSQAAGELTPTFKVKRAAVYDKYASVFAGLYESGER